MATKKDDDKVFDVSKPGTSKPQTGSKPMVVGHNAPTVSDPTLKDEIDKAAAKALEPKDEKLEETASDHVDSSEDNNDTEDKKPAAKKVIKPLSEEEKAKDSTTSEIESKEADSKNDNEPTDDDESKDASDIPEENSESPEVAVAADESPKAPEQTEAPTPETTEENPEEQLTDEEKKKKKEKDAGDVQLERENKLNEIIKSKEYDLHIKESRNSPAAQFFIILLVSLVIGLAIIAVLIDAEIINTTVTLPFDFL